MSQLGRVDVIPGITFHPLLYQHPSPKSAATDYLPLNRAGATSTLFPEIGDKVPNQGRMDAVDPIRAGGGRS